MPTPEFYAELEGDAVSDCLGKEALPPEWRKYFREIRPGVFASSRLDRLGEPEPTEGEPLPCHFDKFAAILSGKHYCWIRDIQSHSNDVVQLDVRVESSDPVKVFLLDACQLAPFYKGEPFAYWRRAEGTVAYDRKISVGTPISFAVLVVNEGQEKAAVSCRISWE